MKKTPRWKNPKLKSQRSKKQKEKRPKHHRPTRDPAWVKLENFFIMNRINTLRSCGFSEEKIMAYFKNTNYYERYCEYSQTFTGFTREDG
jgi:hypothetical protein